MSAFTSALGKTLKWEGNYSNDTADKGGETWRGISRVNHPNWAGWSIVDKYRAMDNFPKSLQGDVSLEFALESFYRVNFWNKISCDEFIDAKNGVVNYSLAEKVFDMAVNLGLGGATKIIQKAVNAILDDYPLINVDGGMGLKTIAAVKEAMILFGCERLVNTLRILQKEKYEKIVKNDPSQSVFLKGWTRRAMA